jgi:hypothetical protein
MMVDVVEAAKPSRSGCAACVTMGVVRMAGMAQPGAAGMTGVMSRADMTVADMRATHMMAADMPATEVTAAKVTAAKMATTEVAAAMSTATVSAATVATAAARHGAGRETQNAKGDAHQKNACCLDHGDFSC